MTQPILSIRDLSISVKGRPLLEEISFDLSGCGLTALMGPTGTGKSTLMKWLCGVLDSAIFDWSVSGAIYLSERLGGDNTPSLIPQSLSQSIDETIERLEAQLACNPALMCVDEVIAQPTGPEAERFLDRLSEIAETRAVLIVSHNQEQMRAHARQVMFMATGCLQEITPTERFFSDPVSEAGRQFLGTGGVSLPSRWTPSRQLSSDLRAAPEAFRVGSDEDAHGLRPLFDGKLAALTARDEAWPTPADLEAARGAGITTLAMFGLPDPGVDGRIKAGGLASIWCSRLRPDLSLADCRAWVAEISASIDKGDHLACVRRGSDVSALFAVAYQLVILGIPAPAAAELLAWLLGVDEISAKEEQLLWDIELSLDLEGEGVVYEPPSDEPPPYPVAEGPTTNRRCA